MTSYAVVYRAPCPGCGQPADWRGSALGQASTSTVDCPQCRTDPEIVAEDYR